MMEFWGIGCSGLGATGAGMVCSDGAVAAAPGTVVMGTGETVPHPPLGPHTAGVPQADGQLAVGYV
jgi:hypothetical protein